MRWDISPNTEARLHPIRWRLIIRVSVLKFAILTNDKELYCSHHEKGVLGDKGKDWADGHGLNHGLPSWYFTPVEVAILVR